MPDPVTQSTHAITIHAPADQVWSWIAQIGQDRGGFYSYTPLENLAGAEMKNADEIHPEWQQRVVGEKVWLGAPAKFDGKAHMIVARWIPGRAIVMVAAVDWERIRSGKSADHSMWSLIVEPQSPKSCRLIARSLGGSGFTTAGKAANFAFWEPAHFIMERGMLLGIKSRAELRTEECFPLKVLHSAAGIVDIARKFQVIE
jgi:hypothetical protein